MQQGSSAELTCHGREALGLSHFHGRRFAVVLSTESSQMTLRGNARYVEDNEGRALRIEVDGESRGEHGHPVFVIRESSWDGAFVRDHEYGCEYQLRLDADPARNRP